MKYKIQPYIQVDNIKYQTLITEIMRLSADDINDVIKGMEDVFSGKYDSNSFSGQHMSIVDFDNNVAKIYYFDDLIGEESTKTIYKMLVDYYNVKIECEKINS